MRLSPEISLVASPRLVHDAGAVSGSLHLVPQKLPGRAGVEEQGEWSQGSSGNLGDPVVSIVTAGRSPAYQLQADPRLPSRAVGDEPRDETMVSPSEGNEVRRDGRQGVGASHSTGEPGEPPEGPRGGKGTPFHNRWRET